MDSTQLATVRPRPIPAQNDGILPVSYSYPCVWSLVYTAVIDVHLQKDPILDISFEYVRGELWLLIQYFI